MNDIWKRPGEKQKDYEKRVMSNPATRKQVIKIAKVVRKVAVGTAIVVAFALGRKTMKSAQS